MTTICGIDTDFLRLSPSTAELGEIIAKEDSDWQAWFIDDLARSLHARCKNRDMQISYIAYALLKHDAGKELIRDLAWWLENEEKKRAEEDAA